MDYENPTDLNSDNLYEIIIRATDNSVDYTEYPLLIRVSNQMIRQSLPVLKGHRNPL